MPRRPPRICSHPGCGAVTATSSRCAAHGGGPRPSASAQGYGSEWRRRRASFLARNPRCESCGAQATVADHQPSRKTLIANGVSDPDADRWLHPMCGPCHSSKTARQDGGFGR